MYLLTFHLYTYTEFRYLTPQLQFKVQTELFHVIYYGEKIMQTKALAIVKRVQR